jgi:hypothetical protein
VIAVAEVLPAASLYAVIRSFWAAAVTASAAKYLVPVVVTVVSPVKVPVGELPMFAPSVPERVVVPVLVIPDPARTAKLFAEPMPTAGIAALAVRVITRKTAAIAATAEMILIGVRFSLLKVEIVIMGSPDYGSRSWSPRSAYT